MEKVNHKGQALTEYVILLAIVVSVFSGVLKMLTQAKVMQNLQKPMTKDFAATYRYGHPKAKGVDEGGPVNIPTMASPENNTAGNFRISINPTNEE
jgi:hypothetical protein